MCTQITRALDQEKSRFIKIPLEDLYNSVWEALQRWNSEAVNSRQGPGTAELVGGMPHCCVSRNCQHVHRALCPARWVGLHKDSEQQGEWEIHSTAVWDVGLLGQEVECQTSRGTDPCQRFSLKCWKRPKSEGWVGGQTCFRDQSLCQCHATNKAIYLNLQMREKINDSCKTYWTFV